MFNKIMPDFQAKLPKTMHNLSQQFTFTAPPGPLLPIWQDMALPGDEYRFNAEIFMRTQPLVTAAMADIDFHVDWFFVPSQMIFTPFGSQLWSTQDLISSNFSNLATLKLPLLVNLSFKDYEIDDTGGPWIAKGFERYSLSCARLFAHLGYNFMSPFYYWIVDTELDIDDDQVVPVKPLAPNVFPWALLTYHTIYYKHYRNDIWEPDKVNYRNADFLWNGSNFGIDDIEPDGNPQFYSCHYAPRLNDYYHSIVSNPLIGSSVSHFNDNAAQFSNAKNWLYNEDITLADDAGDGATLLSSATAATAADHSTAAIRSMFAFEKLLRITGRAEKNYDSQVLAHFGHKVPRDVKHDYTYIGSQHGSLHIGEVLSTAATADAPIGEIAGRGYGRLENGKILKFTAPCHGAVMAIFYIVPRSRAIPGFDRINWIGDIKDIPNPEYFNLGMQPLFGLESDYHAYSESFDARKGWQYRYQQFKRKVDRLSPIFMNPTSGNNDNVWKSWSLYREPFNGVTPSYEDFLVTPHDCDRIMAVPFQDAAAGEKKTECIAKPWEMFQYDPFLVNSKITAYKYSVLTKTGEPDIDGI